MSLGFYANYYEYNFLCVTKSMWLVTYINIRLMLYEILQLDME